MSCAIHARGLRFRYPNGVVGLDRRRPACHPRRARRGVGPNGAGKTTLMFHLNGLLRGEEKSITGLDVGGDVRALRAAVGLVSRIPTTSSSCRTVARTSPRPAQPRPRARCGGSRRPCAGRRADGARDRPCAAPALARPARGASPSQRCSRCARGSWCSTSHYREPRPAGAARAAGDPRRHRPHDAGRHPRSARHHPAVPTPCCSPAGRSGGRRPCAEILTDEGPIRRRTDLELPAGFDLARLSYAPAHGRRRDAPPCPTPSQEHDPVEWLKYDGDGFPRRRARGDRDGQGQHDLRGRPGRRAEDRRPGGRPRWPSARRSRRSAAAPAATATAPRGPSRSAKPAATIAAADERATATAEAEPPEDREEPSDEPAQEAPRALRRRQRTRQGLPGRPPDGARGSASSSARSGHRSGRARSSRPTSRRRPRAVRRRRRVAEAAPAEAAPAEEEKAPPPRSSPATVRRGQDGRDGDPGPLAPAGKGPRRMAKSRRPRRSSSSTSTSTWTRPSTCASGSRRRPTRGQPVPSFNDLVGPCFFFF